jgi:hypothetical protein
MSTEREDIARLTAQVEALLERVMQLEGQVYRLMESPTVEAEAFVLRDDRAEVRARLDIRDHATRLTFYDSIGHERLHIGLHADGTPDVSDLSR